MRASRLRFTIRGLMVVVVIAAVACFIVAQAVAYQRRHLGIGGAWSLLE